MVEQPSFRIAQYIVNDPKTVGLKTVEMGNQKFMVLETLDGNLVRLEGEDLDKYYQFIRENFEFNKQHSSADTEGRSGDDLDNQRRDSAIRRFGKGLGFGTS